jgi:ATP-dependent exoDNAse (exonuclease V) alpha subunit
MTQKQALDLLKLGKNVFLTGAAGSGKTYVLNKYIRYLKKHHVPVAITASTGIAATHMNGKTIHSWAHIGVKDFLTPTDLDHIFKNKEYRLAIAEAKVLIIDEVSMLHHYRLDMVDMVLRKMHGQEHQPFGGIQVVLCGDLFQLPPVTRGGRAEYVTAAAAWEVMDIHVCYLTEQYRHDDDHLSQLLNEMRAGEVSEQSIERLLARQHVKLDNGVAPTKLFTHNADVDAINATELKQLEEDEHTFVMTHRGDRGVAKALTASCLAPEELKLKKGAVVMFVQNNYAKGYVNGTLGLVVDFDGEGMPVVETLQGATISAAMASWRVEEGEEVIAEINQLPLRLAWAITVHKSQGMTLDAAQIDLSKSFIPGMGYVALSRVRRLDTLNLLGLNSRALQVDRRVIELNKDLMAQSKRCISYLKNLGAQEIQRAQEEFMHQLTFSGTLFA